MVSGKSMIQEVAMPKLPIPPRQNSIFTCRN